MDDEALLAAVADGDDGALRALFGRHAPWLAGRLRRALPAGAVEDVVQETFVAVWRGAGGFRGSRSGGGSVGGWIWGIARRQAALWARRHGRDDAGRGLDEVPERAGAADPAAEAAGRVDLERALAAFGPAGDPQGDAQRELVRLVLVEDRPLADVARALGIPEGTVKSRLFAVRRRLRAALGGA